VVSLSHDALAAVRTRYAAIGTGWMDLLTDQKSG
jgi:hypothetical protein